MAAQMAAQMHEIASANRDMERSKIEVQLKLFSEQMDYQREKDRRMYDNAAVANENARLAILKQGEMVNCLAQLSSVLSTGLTMSSAKASGITTNAGYQQYNGTGAPIYPGQPSPRHFGASTFPAAGRTAPDIASTSTDHGNSRPGTRAPPSEDDVSFDKPNDRDSTYATE